MIHISEPAHAVQDCHPIGLLNRAQSLLDRLIDAEIDAVQAAITDSNVVARAVQSLHLERVPAEHRADQYGAVNLLVVALCAQKPVENGADAADLRGCFMGRVDQQRNGIGHNSLEYDDCEFTPS